MEYLVSLVSTAGIFCLLAFSAYIIAITGQLSFGQQAFFAIGAHMAAVCTVLWGLHLAAALVIGAVVAGAVAFLVSIPTLRMRGLYFSVATLAFAEMTRLFFLNFSYQEMVDGQLKGPVGPIGFRSITYNVDHLITPEKYFGIIYLVVALAVIFFVFLERSRLGSVLRIVEEDETAAQALGINVTGARMLAFTMGGILAGLGGGLYAHFMTFIKHSNFNLMMGVHTAAHVLIGGLGSFLGPMLGVGIETSLAEILRPIGAYRMLAFGSLIVIILILRPRGIIDEQLVRSFRQSAVVKKMAFFIHRKTVLIEGIRDHR